jgi:flagellar biosynthesis protein FlhG
MKLIVAVGGGKGGTGKSLVAANLAVAMAQAGRRVIIVDADLGGANLHTLLGINRPTHLLEHFVTRKVARLDQVLCATQQPNLLAICGGMPVLGTANPSHAQKQKLIRHIRNLEAEVIVLDVGAGSAFNVLDLYNAAAIKLVVLTPEITSVHNAYGFLKAALLRHIAGALSPQAREHLESAGPERGAELMREVIERVGRFDTGQGETAARALSDYKVRLVGNMLGAPKESHVIEAVSRLIADHLHVRAPVVGILRRGDKMMRSINERRPFMMSAGIEQNAVTLRGMAEALLAMGATCEPESVVPPRPAYERESPRFPICLRALLCANGTSMAGEVRNVSDGGFLVTFPSSPDGPVEGVLRVGPAADGTELDVRVAECHRDPSGLHVGFKLVAPTDAVLESMARIVAQAVAGDAIPCSAH